MVRMRVSLLIAVVLIFVIVPAVYAGGWAIVTVKDVPDYAVAGKPFTLTFSVRQHGLTLIDGLDPTVIANKPNHQTLKFSVKATGNPGEYRAELKLTETGAWNVEVHSGFLRFLLGNSKAEDPKLPEAGYVFLPLEAVAAGKPAPSISDGDRGERLFAAKGCNGCHGTGIGPELNGKHFSKDYSKDYLKKFLADPAGTLKLKAKLEIGQMPNPNLRVEEIAALSEFLTKH